MKNTPRLLAVVMAVTCLPGLSAIDALGAARPGEKPPATVVELGQGVLVDLERARAYVMNPKGGMEALDLLTGKSVWTSSHADKPLLLQGSLVVAQASVPGNPQVLRIVVLDVNEGGKLLRTLDSDLPQGAEARTVGDQASAFRSSAEFLDPRVLVTWTHTPGGGARRSEEASVVTDRSLRGAFQFELLTGKVSSASSSDLRRRSSSRPGTSKHGRGKQYARPAWDAGGHLAALRTFSMDDGEYLLLERWDGATGKPMTPITMHSGPYAYQRVSEDGRTVLVATVGDEDAFSWSFYSADDGRPLGRIPGEAAIGRFLAAGSVLVVKSREEIIVRGLSDGAEVWRRRARD